MYASYVCEKACFDYTFVLLSNVSALVVIDAKYRLPSALEPNLNNTFFSFDFDVDIDFGVVFIPILKELLNIGRNRFEKTNH